MNRRIRVLHVITDAGPHPYFDLIGKHADRERFDVRIATLGPVGALHRAAERMGLPALALGARGRRSYPVALARLVRHLRRERIDILQAHLLDGAVIGLLAARLARIPVAIMTAHHCHEIPLHHRPALTFIDRLCAGPLCDAIIAPSAQMSDTLMRVHRAGADKVTVVHHGFELDRLDPARVDGGRVRAELGLEGRLVIGSIGRLYWIKNQEALVRAFASVAPTAPDAVLLLVGGGDPVPIRRLARALGLDSGRVVVLAPRDDVPELLAAIDLFVHPALAESFAMVIVEAMAMARPVLSTPVGIVPEIVEHGNTGLLARDGSVRALAQAISHALATRGRWPDIGAEARRTVGGLRAERMIEEYEQLYTYLMTFDSCHRTSRWLGWNGLLRRPRYRR
jgi:glycosyltransferase involved in cell wall biosynthesis